MNTPLLENPRKKSGRPRRGEEGWHVSRNLRLIYFRELGETYTELGRRFGISRQRVGIILRDSRPDLLGGWGKRAEA